VNGAGKSTLLKTIAGLLDPLSGQVLFNDKRIDNISFSDRAHIISIVLTEKITVPYLSVFDVVAAGRSPYTGTFGKLSEEDISITKKYLERCGIAHLQDKASDEISDGEKQKCMLARSLAQETPVIILDEPTSYLDFRARYEIMELLKNISAEEKKIILFSSHDLEIVFKTSDRCVVFLKDEIIQQNTNDLLSTKVTEQLLKGTNLYFDKLNKTINYKNKI
jgi:iron complex transport system ATP-binding protein